MKWTADMHILTVGPVPNAEFTITPIEAADEMDAAREAARLAAEHRYGAEGATGFVTWRGTNLYLASIGVQQLSATGCVTRGSTVSIKVRAA